MLSHTIRSNVWPARVTCSFLWPTVARGSFCLLDFHDVYGGMSSHRDHTDRNYTSSNDLQVELNHHHNIPLIVSLGWLFFVGLPHPLNVCQRVPVLAQRPISVVLSTADHGNNVVLGTSLFILCST